MSGFRRLPDSKPGPCPLCPESDSQHEEAAKRELYDELVEAELGAYLTAHPSSFNIIVVLRHLGLFGIINPPGDREGGGQE
jgi:hypothetical protein